MAQRDDGVKEISQPQHKGTRTPRTHISITAAARNAAACRLVPSRSIRPPRRLVLTFASRSLLNRGLAHCSLGLGVFVLDGPCGITSNLQQRWRSGCPVRSLAWG